MLYIYYISKQLWIKIMIKTDFCMVFLSAEVSKIYIYIFIDMYLLIIHKCFDLDSVVVALHLEINFASNISDLNTGTVGKHVFISYSWKNKDIVWKISEELKVKTIVYK